MIILKKGRACTLKELLGLQLLVSTLVQQTRSPGLIPGRGKNFSVPLSAVLPSSLPGETWEVETSSCYIVMEAGNNYVVRCHITLTTKIWERRYQHFSLDHLVSPHLSTESGGTDILDYNFICTPPPPPEPCSDRKYGSGGTNISKDHLVSVGTK